MGMELDCSAASFSIWAGTTILRRKTNTGLTARLRRPWRGGWWWCVPWTLAPTSRPPTLLFPQEENPAMGMRAIRICLTRPQVFRTQLRALYRASVHGNLAIMFPMITSLEEVRQVKRICRQVRQELQEAGVPFRARDAPWHHD